MIAKINQLLQEVEALKAANAEELEALRIKYLSKKGAINDLMADFRNVAAEQKKEVGMRLNELKNKAQEKIAALKEQFESQDTGCDDIDLTRSAYPIELGTRHPLSIVRNEIIDIFARMGFNIADGPETSVVTSESNAIGGWSEEDGYFVNPQAYSKAMEDGTTYASPKHTGKAEERTHNGTSQKRAHGWTTWVGKYHYTRARMEDWGAILTDSGRQWGTDGTEAISPWWSFNGDTSGSARTYYGS